MTIVVAWRSLNYTTAALVLKCQVEYLACHFLLELNPPFSDAKLCCWQSNSQKTHSHPNKQAILKVLVNNGKIACGRLILGILK